MYCIVLITGRVELPSLIKRGEDVDSQLKRGLLEYCVLAFLLPEPSYGYEIIKHISPIIHISESTLYPILKRLENQQLVTTYKEEYSGRLRKYYRITAKGEEKLRIFYKGKDSVVGIYEYIGGRLENG